MGCKRPFEEMEFEELHFKHPRQLEYSNKPASFSEFFSSYNTQQEPFIAGKDEGGPCKYQWTETHEKDDAAKTSTLVDKDFMTSNSLSLVTNCSGEEHTGVGPLGEVACPQPPGYFEFDLPRRSFAPLDDVYSLPLDCSPRKQVPVGPNYQATIPICRGKVNEKRGDQTEVLESRASFSHSSGPNVIDNYNEERLVGTCVIPMPDSNLFTQEGVKVVIGRTTECGCLDAGSVRCVRQHVEESRENLRKSLGDKIFVNLGFCEMGEEVSYRWSEEEELDFHEVVYSNPVSLGRNFWKRLSAVFDSRSKEEIVSYYFNVFMLRKRASQNRSKLLEIDSDDDEWHGSNGAPREVRDSEDEDSAIESVGDQVDKCHREEDFSEEESEDDDSTDGGDDCDDNVGRHTSESFMPKLVDGCKFDPIDKISTHFQDDCIFQDDSCMSFDCQANMSNFCGLVNDGDAFKARETKTENNKFPYSKPDASPGVVDHLYISEPLDSKVWDSRYTITCPVKSFDLPPWDMIEDIFGEGQDDCKSSDDLD